MDRDYAILETLPDGGVLLHACVHELTLRPILELLAKESRNAILRDSCAGARHRTAREREQGRRSHVANPVKFLRASALVRL